MNRRMITAILTTCLLILRIQACLAYVISEGSCGPAAAYTLDSDGVLTVSGTGAITQKPVWRTSTVEQVKTIVIKEGITSIGSESAMEIFKNLKNVTDVTLPAGLEFICADAFYGCEALKEITIPGNVKYIGIRAFYFCRGLASLTLQEGVQTIEYEAFQQCTALKELMIPGSARIGNEAFVS